MKIKAIDLFCGGGASSWGARQAGVEIVGAVDAWDIATATYSDNFPKAEVVTKRLTDKTGAEIFRQQQKVDLLLGSPECTHHSIARGARPRDEESRRSGEYVLKFLHQLQPRWLVLENVGSMRRWEGFGQLLESLEKLGYRTSLQLLDASDFGVPQTRKRLFIIGDKLAKPPKVTPPSSVRARTVAEILDSPTAWPVTSLFSDRRAAATLERARRAITELGEGQDFLIVYYSSDRAGGWQTLDRPLRTMTTLDRFGLVRWKHGTPTFRMLQVPELRRAMGLPDGFKLEQGTRRDKVRLLGNGVCAPVMEQIVKSLTLQREDEEETSRIERRRSQVCMVGARVPLR